MSFGHWEYRTSHGTFRIVPRARLFHPFYEDEELGSYPTVIMALDDLVGGYTYFPSNGLDPSACGLPDELSLWTFVRAR